MTLLEVLVALVLVGTAGSAWLLLLAETRLGIATAYSREDRVARAADLLRDVAQRSDSTLLSIIGRRRVGDLELRVSVTSPHLFEVVVAEPGRDALLRTFLYRPREDVDAH